MMPGDQVKISRLFLGNANAYILCCNDEIAIIDGGLGNRVSCFQREIAQLVTGSARVRYIAVTHAHYDHVGSILALKKAFPEALIVAHEIEAENLQKGLSPVPKGTMWFSRPISWLGCRIFRHCIRFAGFSVDLKFSGSLILDLGGGILEFFHTPGHTAGSMCARFQNLAVFAGDTIFHVLPGRIYPPFADYPDLLYSSWQIIADKGCQTIYPGHGRPVRQSQLVNFLQNPLVPATKKNHKKKCLEP